jgi:hypothetical protein
MGCVEEMVEHGPSRERCCEESRKKWVEGLPRGHFRVRYHGLQRQLKYTEERSKNAKAKSVGG